jgi:hypothetical protein
MRARRGDNGKSPTSLTTLTAARRAATRRQRKLRARQRNGQAVYEVTVDGSVLDMLVRLRWLLEGQTGDRRQVAKAIAAMLAEASQNIS